MLCSLLLKLKTKSATRDCLISTFCNKTKEYELKIQNCEVFSKLFKNYVATFIDPKNIYTHEGKKKQRNKKKNKQKLISWSQEASCVVGDVPSLAQV